MTLIDFMFGIYTAMHAWIIVTSGEVVVMSARWLYAIRDEHAPRLKTVVVTIWLLSIGALVPSLMLGVTWWSAGNISMPGTSWHQVGIFAGRVCLVAGMLVFLWQTWRHVCGMDRAWLWLHVVIRIAAGLALFMAFEALM